MLILSSQVYLTDHSFSHSDPHQIDFMMIISIDIDCYRVVFENLSIQWMKIVDWRLIRVLMIEVNMITYEWNRDDLKENENMKDEVDMNWLFVWRRVFEIVNWYWLNRCNDIESIEIEYENDDDLMRIVSFRITIWDNNDMRMIEYDDWIEWIWIEDEMI